jgi:hypothetical protein
VSLKDLAGKALGAAKKASTVYSDNEDKIDGAIGLLKNFATASGQHLRATNKDVKYRLPATIETKIKKEEIDEIINARTMFNSSPFIIRLTNAIGRPIESGINSLPEDVQQKIAKATTTSLNKALDVAVRTLDSEQKKSRKGLHMMAAAATGAIGGAFGVWAIAVELPISTTIMLRSIADIARENGENIKEEDAMLQCLSVFSLGGGKESENLGDSSYYAIRASLATLITEAASYLSSKKATEIASSNVPVLINLIAKIAARFNVQVSEMAMAQLIPIIGAAGGATINTLFIDHYQDMASGHFSIRRLERSYGEEEVKMVYDNLESIAFSDHGCVGESVGN